MASVTFLAELTRTNTRLNNLKTRASDWTVRYGSKGPETEARRRAVAQYRGNWLD